MTSKKNISKKKNGEIESREVGMDKKIILKKKKKKEAVMCGVVKLSPEAETIVKQLSWETDRSIKEIVSEIIIQGYEFVEILEEEEQ